MTFDSGVARAAYILSIDQPKQAAAELRALFQSIKADAASLSAAVPTRASGAAPAFGPTAQNTSQVVAYANAQARLVQIQNTGKSAADGLRQAEQIYQEALTKVNVNSIEAIRLESQLATVRNRLAKETGGGQPILPRTVESFGTEAIDQFKSGLLSIVGPAALVTTALAAIPKAIDLAEEGAKAQRTAAAFDGLAKSAGSSGDALLSALRKASGGEVSDLNLELAATKAQFTGVATSAADFSRLLAIARNNGREFGLSTEEAFNRLVDALDKGQARGLKQIGINVDLKKAEQAYAQSIGVTVASLDEEQKRQALVQATLAEGDAQLQRTGGAVADNAAQFDRFNAAAGNVKTGLGSFLADGLAPLAGQFATTVETTQQFIDYLKQAKAAIFGVQQQAAAGGGGGGGSALADVDAQKALADSLELTGIRARAAALATEQKSNADKLAATDSQTHALAVKQLDEQVTAAANALLAEGPAGARAAALLASSSSLVDQRTAAEYRLLSATIAVNNANNQKATDQAVATGRFFGRESGRGGGSDAAADSAAFVGVLKAQNTEQQKLLDSEIALAGAKKNTAKEIDLLRQKQSQYQKGTAEYNQIEAQIIGVQTAAGRTRVSAAASTGLQLQNIEENTQAELLKAQREGLERLRDQEQDFDLKRSRSKEDEDEKIRGLLARGQRAEAAREAADFAKKQKRDAEDFNIQRQRTLRNNNESTGDITGGAARKTDQLDARAALRGTRPVAAGGASAPILSAPQAAAATSSAPTVIQVNVGANVNLDSQQVGTLIFDVIRQRLDADLALELRSATPPGAGQSAVAGARP